MNRIKNGNPSRVPSAPIAKQQPPPQRNDIPMFIFFNCGNMGHMTKRCKRDPKPATGSNAQVNLIDQEFVTMITEINMVGEYYG